MTDCIWNGRENPRVVRGRHEANCSGDCNGCQECTEAHCRICRHTHADGTCAECMAETREALHAIGTLCESLPTEVKHRGIEGEAMMLLGPSADPEARGHLEASIAAGRVPADYLDTADGELHPLFVLGTWDMTWRDALEHDEPSEKLTIGAAIGYLDRTMTYMGGYEHVPFEDFARDLRRCQAHLEAVLHDGEQRELSRVVCDQDRCKDDPPRLEVLRGATKTGNDLWRCPRCKYHFTHEEMLKAHGKQLRHESAEKYVYLPDAIGTLRAQGRSEHTVRKWLIDDDPSSCVGRYCDPVTKKIYVWWPDLWRRHLMTTTRKRSA